MPLLNIKTEALPVTDVAVKIGAVGSSGVMLRSLSTSANTCYWGGPDVTPANGIEFLPGESIAFGDIEVGGSERDIDMNKIFVVCDTGEAASLRVARFTEG